MPPPPSASRPPLFRVAEVYLFDACTQRCGYCWLAESGQVLDYRQLEPFRDPAFVEKICSFFVKRTTAENRWLAQFTGGEPLLCPNLDRLLEPLAESGTRTAFYTALMVGPGHPGFRALLRRGAPAVDYVMVSFHPEAERQEAAFFDKLRMLKDAGHRLFLRFVGHPARLQRLEELAERCRQMDICFYPTALLSNRYPAAYQDAEKASLRRHFSSLSQHIQLEGGLSTDGLRCRGGSGVIGVNLQTGAITPCITVAAPLLGNIFEDRLELESAPITCPKPGIDCICDVHFQQDIVPIAADRERFQTQLHGFTEPRLFDAELAELRRGGVRFYSNRATGMGGVADDARLFYSVDEARENYRRTLGLPRTRLEGKDLREIAGALGQPVETGGGSVSGGTAPLRVVTPEARWSYGAALPLALPKEVTGEAWLRLRATVVTGEAGFGVLDRAGVEFQDRCFLAASAGAQTFFLRIANPTDVSSVILQNATAEGGRAEILLHEAAVLAAPGAAPELPEAHSFEELQVLYPRLASECTGDFERVCWLRDWVYRHLLTASPKRQLPGSAWSNHLEEQPQAMLAQFQRNEGGVACAGASMLMRRVAERFGFRAATIDAGNHRGRASHDFTLVEIEWRGARLWSVQDAYFNHTLTDPNGAPLDYRALFAPEFALSQVRVLRGPTTHCSILYDPGLPEEAAWWSAAASYVRNPQPLPDGGARAEYRSDLRILSEPYFHEYPEWLTLNAGDANLIGLLRFPFFWRAPQDLDAWLGGIREGMVRKLLSRNLGVCGEGVREAPGAVAALQTCGLDCVIEGGEPARLLTPEGMWSYGAAMPVNIPAGTVGQFWVRARVQVLRGQLGVGLLNLAGTDFQDRAFVSPAAEPSTIFLKVTHPADASSLILQNATPTGQRAEALFYGAALLSVLGGEEDSRC
jgi:organic radical activating enzyme